jgi:hypothetical protein
MAFFLRLLHLYHSNVDSQARFFRYTSLRPFAAVSKITVSVYPGPCQVTGPPGLNFLVQVVLGQIGRVWKRLRVLLLMPTTEHFFW